ncbi:MAG: DUF1552 domain-containing protein [Pirellulales bacterium]
MSMQRRTLLKTLATGSVAPFLEPLVARAEAEASGRRPMRFVFLIEGNGLHPAQIQPVGIERKFGLIPHIKEITDTGFLLGRQISAADSLVDEPLSGSDVSLPPSIAPLDRHRDRLTIIQGMSGRICGGGHFNAFGALGCYPQQAGAKDVTIDAALAKAHPGVHQHVALGFQQNPSPSTPPTFYGCSASGPNLKVPHYQDPMLAYDMLFGTILGGNKLADVGTQSLLLDHMAKDIRRLERQLPAAEAEKVERYADAFAAIARRQSRLGDIDAARIPPKRDEAYGSMSETKRMSAHVEIAATALITGLTNVVTLCSGGAAYPTWRSLGSELDNHGLAHRAGDEINANPDTPEMNLRVKIHAFHAELVAQLVDQLEAIPEGEGTMMDNTLIVYLSDSAECHHSTCFEWPMVLVGNLGGRLKTGNRFLNVPQYLASDAHVTVSQFYNSLLHAAGAPVEQFGMKDRVLLRYGFKQEGPWTDILA